MKISFTKATAAGNDFVLVDNRDLSVKNNIDKFVNSVCDRRFGIGADGVIFIEEKEKSYYIMKYYNSDGSLGSLCGNGARCTSKYIYEKIEHTETVHFEAVGKKYSALVSGDMVTLFLPDLELQVKENEIIVNEQRIKSYFIDTGSPHAVIFCHALGNEKSLEDINVFKFGREIRNSPVFFPGGTNVNFISINNEKMVFIRTYERGVEDETFACGTGSIASGIISNVIEMISTPVRVITKSGEVFIVDFLIENDYIKNLSLKGSARLLFDGHFNFDFENNCFTYLS